MRGIDRAGNLLGALALVTTDAVRSATEVAAGQTDATPAALVALLGRARGRSVDELRRVVGLTPSGGVRLVDRLVAADMATRRTGADRRTVIVGLTVPGRRVARAVLAARATALERILAPLDGADRAELERLTAILVAGHARQRLADRAAGDVPSGGWTCRLCDQVACGRPAGECPAANAARAGAGAVR